jgi:septal ring factor EnvC (AmiA/AmiB activator)
VTRYPAFIVRAAEAKLRDALDHANDQVRRLEAENATLQRKLSEITKSHDVAVEGWIRVAGERDELAREIADYRGRLKATSDAANRYANVLFDCGLEVPDAQI